MSKRKPKPLLHTFSAGGTKHGMSTYEAMHGCLRSAELYAEARAAGRTFMDEKSPLTIGSIAHAFMEMHFRRELSGKTDPVAIKFSDVVDEEARFEAERVFRAWRVAYPSPREFGKVLYVEETVESCPEICEAVGVDPFSIKPDLVTLMDAKDVLRICNSHEIAGGKLIPGRWLVDHKFDSRKTGYLVDSSLVDHRFHSYTLAWNAARPKEKVQGVIRNTWFKYKEPKGLLVVVPAPNETQVRSLHQFFATACAMNEMGPIAIPTKQNCFPYGGVCRWRREGLCDGV